MPYFCYQCNQLREKCPPGAGPGSCAVVEANAEEYRAEVAAGRYDVPTFQTARLRADNAGGYTQREIAKDIFDRARSQGRDIQRVH